MRMRVFLLVSGLLLVFVSHEPSLSLTPPFPDPLRVHSAAGEPYSVDCLASLLHARINALPYMLARYYKSGDLVLARSIRENLSALDLYVNQMGQSIGNDRQKEMFAKLLAGSQNLKERVEENFTTIEEYRRAERFFQYRADLLIHWIEARKEELNRQCGSQGTGPQEGFATIVLGIRIDLLKAVFLSTISTSDSETQPRRQKARDLWESIVQKGGILKTSASTPQETEFAAVLESSLKNVRNLSRDLFIRRDELNQAWDQTYSMVESFEALFTSPTMEKTPSSEK